jgi:cold-inducible RNA-binding protein
MTNNRLYVRNLPYRLHPRELEQFFNTKGSVISVRIIIDQVTGRSKGFGFIEMSNEEEAQKAIAELNGVPLGGRPIAIELANPLPERPQNDPS